MASGRERDQAVLPGLLRQCLVRGSRNLARHGWVFLRLDLPTLDWDQVREIVVDSYRLVAPK